MTHQTKIQPRAYSVTVYTDNDYSIILCNSYFHDTSRQSRGFEFIHMAMSFPRLEVSSGRPFIDEGLLGSDFAAYADQASAAPVETVIRQKMAEVFGSSARVFIKPC